ncbi:hypothetical protein WR25_25167 [Diploscapter pachys]|uniref:Uncharacterized protein n=1 Tax=Diploscapter pachys TaxID=2018661 RepID=A0A2A2LVV5_9BILA|nr:hypothetical protein WR25_25167 [Diploscapter pachys]
MVSIGIDLGTTYSCAAIIENGRPHAIHCEDGGKNIVPSVVAFSEKETLVGNSALNCDTDLSNILYDSKRLIGWHILNDLPNADDRQLWTFDVDTRNNSAGYVLNKGKSNEKFILPEEVSAKILKSLKDQAEDGIMTKFINLLWKPKKYENPILFYGPDPPEWREYAPVAYFKNKLYYLGGLDSETEKTNRVDLLMDGIIRRYIDYQTMNGNGLKSAKFQKNEIISELHR